MVALSDSGYPVREMEGWRDGGMGWGGGGDGGMEGRDSGRVNMIGKDNPGAQAHSLGPMTI